MRILFVGDIVGKPGREAISGLLRKVIGEYGIEFTIANGENAAGGMGITPAITMEILGTIVLFIPAFVFCWTYTSIVATQLQEIPEGVYGLLMVLLGGKVIQKAIEVAGEVAKKKT